MLQGRDTQIWLLGMHIDLCMCTYKLLVR
uniref:Uncharacterized protein n=1 Tax=Anguilla anguilla TaxID=7936 RepID=A0A0E9QXQ5_ANGAN